MRIRLGGLGGDGLEGHLLFLLSLEQRHLDGVVTRSSTEQINIESFHKSLKKYLLVDEKPATSVHKKTTVGAGHVSGTTRDHTLNLHLTRGQEVDAGDRLVADGHVTANSADLEALEGRAVLEEGAVRSTHGELHLGELGHDAEETHLLSSEDRGALQVSWPHHFCDCYLLLI